MGIRVSRSLLGVTALLTGIIGLKYSATEAADPLPEADAKGLVSQDTKNILDRVEKVANAKPEVKKGVSLNSSKAIQNNAMMIAVVAQKQISGKNTVLDSNMATLRDAAIKIALLGESKRFTAIAEPTNALAGLKANAKAKINMSIANIAKAGNLDVEILMHQFKSTVVGGYGTEEQIQDLGDPTVKNAIALPEAKQMAARLLAVADYFEVLEPAKGFGKTPKPAWLGFTKDMRTAANEMVSAVESKDAKKIKAAFQKLDASCIACHGKYK
jgi:Cytochrome C'